MRTMIAIAALLSIAACTADKAPSAPEAGRRTVVSDDADRMIRDRRARTRNQDDHLGRIVLGRAFVVEKGERIAPVMKPAADLEPPTPKR